MSANIQFAARRGVQVTQSCAGAVKRRRWWPRSASHRRGMRRGGESRRLCGRRLAIFHSWRRCRPIPYTVIDDCSNPANQVATLLGYIHIVFQPFFAKCDGSVFRPGGDPAACRRAGLRPLFLFDSFHAALCVSIRLGRAPASYNVPYALSNSAQCPETGISLGTFPSTGSATTF